MNEEYIQFIGSEQWNLLRTLRKIIDKNTCQFCGDKINIQVHHKYNGGPRYRHITELGNENPENCLICLCARCHETLTLDIRKRREENKTIKRRK